MSDSQTPIFDSTGIAFYGQVNAGGTAFVTSPAPVLTTFQLTKKANTNSEQGIEASFEM